MGDRRDVANRDWSGQINFRKPNSSVCACDGGCPRCMPVQTKPNGHSIVDGSRLAKAVYPIRSGGQALPEETRHGVESFFGADFGDVRIHADETAFHLNKKINAQAFTLGSDIYFNRGKYNPGSLSGRWLLAHELTHTLQQRNRSLRLQRAPNSPRFSPARIRRLVLRYVTNAILESSGGDQSRLSILLHLLRVHHRLILQDPVLHPMIKKSINQFLEGDTRWNALAVMLFGSERGWPIRIRLPMTKGRFCHEMRKWRDGKGKPEPVRDPAYQWLLASPGRGLRGGLVPKVFRYGDKQYITNLVRWGSEFNWPKWAVRKITQGSSAQMRLAKPTHGWTTPKYGRIRGRRAEKSYVTLRYTDIKQLALGDCYFLAALAAMAKQRHELLSRMIRVNPNDTVTVTFYEITASGRFTNNIRYQVTILPGFPMYGRRSAYAQTTLERTKKGELRVEYWVPVLEKAYALWKGSGGGYQGIVGGWPKEVFKTFTGQSGKPETWINETELVPQRLPSGRDHPNKKIRVQIIKVTESKIKSAISSGLADKRPVALSTFTIPEEKDQVDKSFWRSIRRHTKSEGFFNDHSYAVTAIQGSVVTLYNPHGTPRGGVVTTTTRVIRDIFYRLDVGPKLGP